jgi:hypothetical protein
MFSSDVFGGRVVDFLATEESVVSTETKQYEKLQNEETNRVICL